MNDYLSDIKASKATHDMIVNNYPITEVSVKAIMATYQHYEKFVDSAMSILVIFQDGIKVIAKNAEDLSKLADEVQQEIKDLKEK